MKDNNNKTEETPKKEKTYRISIREYRNNARQKTRMQKIKQKVAELSRIVKQAK